MKKDETTLLNIKHLPAPFRHTSSHITNQIPFYLFYYFAVYVFLLVIQLGMLSITIRAKWIRPYIEEPAWIFPIDVVLVCMLVLEVGVHAIVAFKKKKCKKFFLNWHRVMDCLIASVSLIMVLLDAFLPSRDVEDGESSAGKIDFFRDVVRAAKSFEFAVILNEVVHDPDWHANPSLRMHSVL